MKQHTLQKLLPSTFYAWAFAIISLAYTHILPAANIEKMDRIIAIVDQSVITEQELLEKAQSVAMQLEKKGAELPSQAILQKQVLERLIVDSLQLQFAAKVGIKISDAQLDKTIERIAEQNNMGIADFKQALTADGVNFYKFRESIRDEITIARLKEREIANRVIVTEGEIDNYLMTQSGKTGEQFDYAISQILIKTPTDASPEDLEVARKRTEEVLKAIADGMSFEKASATYSDAGNALEGGDLGWKNAQQIPPVFLEQLKAMDNGEITKPIRSPGGIHIFKLNDKRTPDTTLMVPQTRVRHILVKTNEIVSDKDAQQKLLGLRERLVNGEKFEDLARQYSDDGSAGNGGILGWVNKGDTVPQFENTMTSLAINEISEPVRSPFGWHIIEVLERREKDMSKESKRLKARQTIRNRKIEEDYTNWVREMRDRAFVELRLKDTF